MARPSTLAGYRSVARERITAYLYEHQAALRPELVTHLAEFYFQTDATHFNIDPHVSTPVIAEMCRTGELMVTVGATRGSREIETLLLDLDGTTTNQERAAARKRLLYARYLSWTSGSRSRPGSAGPAAESAVRTALTGVANLAPMTPGFGPVSNIAGVALPGPLDSGVLVTADPMTAPVIAPLEVKNVRYWLYPSSEEPWQLIWKALHLSAAQPSWRVAPVLICRRAHSSLFWMARDLGLLVRELRSSPMGNVDEAHLQEVRTELGFSDLKTGSEPPPKLRGWFSNTLAHQAASSAATWAETISDPTCLELLVQLAGTRASDNRTGRKQLLDQLDTRCQQMGRPGWSAARYSSK